MLEKSLRNGALGFIFSLGLFSCGTEPASTIDFQFRLPFDGNVFDLLVVDTNHDQLNDLIAVEHGKNKAFIYRQKETGGFVEAGELAPVGFHPSQLMLWDPTLPVVIQAAEGDGKIRAFTFDPEGKPRLLSELEEPYPQYLGRFHWSDWPQSMVISPYHQNYAVIYKGYDPLKGALDQRLEVAVSQKRPSVVEPEQPALVDLNGDGEEDILYAARISEQLIALSRPAQSDEPPLRRLLLESPDWGMPANVYPADLNGDGIKDLLLPDETRPGLIRVLLNDPQGNLKEGAPLDTAETEGISRLATGVDSDGSRLVVTAEFDRLRLFRLEGAWQPGNAATFKTVRWQRNRANALVMSDLNRDGWLDLVVPVVNGPDAIWVVYGPLWENFEKTGPDFLIGSGQGNREGG